MVLGKTALLHNIRILPISCTHFDVVPNIQKKTKSVKLDSEFKYMGGGDITHNQTNVFQPFSNYWSIIYNRLFHVLFGLLDC
jgi:hypothetical protein